MSDDFNSEDLQKLANILQERFGFSTSRQLDLAVADIVKKTALDRAHGRDFALSRLVRGSMAIMGHCIAESTRESDVQFVRALTPGSGAGAYLVPTIQADQIIEMLTTGNVLRQSGCRVWDMTGIQNMNVPLALLAPSFVWMAPNSQQTPTDPNIGQMSFNLKTQRCLIAIPNELLKVSVPSFDTLLATLIAQGAAEAEDTAVFSTTQLSGGPVPLYAAASTTKILVGGNANGGNLAYSDIVAVLAQAAKVKAKPPFCWITGVRTFYSRILGLTDTASRPLVIPTLTTGLAEPVRYTLFGWPVFISPFFDEAQANGSGTNQSWLCFTNPNYLHIGQGTGLEVMTSLERYFDFNQVAIRCTRQTDFNIGPPQGVVILQGIN